MGGSGISVGVVRAIVFDSGLFVGFMRGSAGPTAGFTEL